MLVLILAILSISAVLAQNTSYPLASGTTLPATCYVGQGFFKTDAAPGSNLYGCTATDTWTIQGGGGARSFGFQFGERGGTTVLTADKLAPAVRVPYACTITAYSICAAAGADAAPGTVTVKFLKVASGTAQPVAANSINTSGVSLTTGTCVRSTTLSDFTTTAVAANDLVSATDTAIGTAVYLSAQVECTI